MRSLTVIRPTVARLCEALQNFPPHFVLDFSPGDVGDITEAAVIEELEGTTSDGPGSVWIKLIEKKDAPYAQVLCDGDELTDGCGYVPLTEAQYMQQMDQPDRTWRCPCCLNEVSFDDLYFEQRHDMQDTSKQGQIDGIEDKVDQCNWPDCGFDTNCTQGAACCKDKP